MGIAADSVWMGSWFLVFRGIACLASNWRVRSGGSLESGRLLIKDLREMLSSGQLPTPQAWARLSEIPSPWGSLIVESLSELRESGLPVVPTLERLEVLLQEQIGDQAQARARCAQAWAQAVISASFVPGLSIALFFLLPGVAEWGAAWWLLSSLACMMSLLALVWMLGMADSARWAGLKKAERPSWPALLCFAERLLASLRSGVPADQAWARAIPSLARSSKILVLQWGAEFWIQAVQPSSFQGNRECAFKLLENWGLSVRERMQRSLLEGRPCSDTIETSLAALKEDWGARVEREMGLLGTRALQPLFLLVAPGLLGLMALAFLGAAQL